MYILLITSTGPALAIALGGSSEAGPIAQTITLQFMSILFLSASMVVSQRATDKKRFAILMLMVYFQVDYFQTSLLITSNFASPEFWKMIVIGELSSLFKNCGLLAYVSYLVCIRSTNPYGDEEFMGELEKKGLVDSMSEILVIFAIAVVFMLEKEVRSWGGIDLFNVTVPAGLNNGTEGYFITEGCGLTCVGWTVNDGIPPPSVEELKSRWEVVGALAVILVVRVCSLMIERVGLKWLTSFLNKGNSVAVAPEESVYVDEEGVEDVVTQTGERRALSKRTSEVADAATSVFEGVTLLFLFFAFMYGIGGCSDGLRVFMTFAPIVEGVEVNLVPG